MHFKDFSMHLYISKKPHTNYRETCASLHNSWHWKIQCLPFEFRNDNWNLKGIKGRLLIFISQVLFHYNILNISLLCDLLQFWISSFESKFIFLYYCVIPKCTGAASNDFSWYFSRVFIKMFFPTWLLLDRKGKKKLFIKCHEIQLCYSQTENEKQWKNRNNTNCMN